MSVLLAVIASSFASKFSEVPERLSELQFCELTVNEGASTAPVADEYNNKYNYLVVMESGQSLGLLPSTGWVVERKAFFSERW
jgi:hypothetical protein